MGFSECLLLMDSFYLMLRPTLRETRVFKKKDFSMELHMCDACWSYNHDASAEMG